MNREEMLEKIQYLFNKSLVDLEIFKINLNFSHPEDSPFIIISLGENSIEISPFEAEVIVRAKDRYILDYCLIKLFLKSNRDDILIRYLTETYDHKK